MRLIIPIKQFTFIMTWLVLQPAIAAYPFDSFADVVAHDPWIREAPPSIRVLAGYVRLENKTDYDIRFVNATSPAFMDIEIHKISIHNGVAQMEHISHVLIPAYKTVQLDPGGFHLMMMGAKRRMKAGDKIPVKLFFSKGSPVSVQMVVKKSF